MTLRYTSVAAADTYFATRLFVAAWDAASDDEKAAALTMSEAVIEAIPWRGILYDSDQDDQWPRVIDEITVDYDVDENEAIVPDEIERTVYEEALETLNTGGSTRRKLQREGVKSYRIGAKISETYSDQPGGAAGVVGLSSEIAYRLIKRWIYSGGPIY